MTTLVRLGAIQPLQPAILGKSRPLQNATVQNNTVKTAPTAVKAAPLRAPLTPRTPRTPRTVALRGRAGRQDASASPLQFDAMARRDLIDRLPANHEASDLWLLFVQDPDVSVRQAVASRGPQALLGDLAQDASPWVRQAVAQRLGHRPEHPAMASLCQDSHFWVRQAAVQSLSQQALPAAAPLVQARLQDEDPWVRATAVQSALVPNAWVANRVVHDPVDWVRHTALRTLAQRDPAAARRAFARLPAAQQGTLVSVLRHFAPQWHERPVAGMMRYLVNNLLVSMEHQPVQVLLDLLLNPHTLPQDGAVESKRNALLDQAVRAWGHPERLKCDAPRSQVMALLYEPNHASSVALHMARASLPQLEELLPVLEMLRSSPNVFARRMAAQLLAQLPHASLTLPMLTSMLFDFETCVRSEAAQSVQQICAKLANPEACLPIAMRLLAAPEVLLRHRGVSILGQIATPATLARLVHVFYHDASDSVRMEAVRALVAHPAAEAVSFLMAVAGHRNPHVRARLAELLENTPFTRAYPVLHKLATDTHPEVLATLTHTLCQYAKPMGNAPVRSEAALRLLDIVDMIPDSVVGRLRSTLLPEALAVFHDRPDMLRMLHGWLERLSEPHIGVIEQLVKSDFPGRSQVLQQLLGSRHPAVAQQTRALLVGRLNVTLQAKASSQS